MPVPWGPEFSCPRDRDKVLPSEPVCPSEAAEAASFTATQPKYNDAQTPPLASHSRKQPACSRHPAASTPSRPLDAHPEAGAGPAPETPVSQSHSSVTHWARRLTEAAGVPLARAGSTAPPSSPLSLITGTRATRCRLHKHL